MIKTNIVTKNVQGYYDNILKNKANFKISAHFLTNAIPIFSNTSKMLLIESPYEKHFCVIHYGACDSSPTLSKNQIGGFC